jgi:hypothetical protein
MASRQRCFLFLDTGDATQPNRIFAISALHDRKTLRVHFAKTPNLTMQYAGVEAPCWAPANAMQEHIYKQLIGCWQRLASAELKREGYQNN